MPTSNMSVFSIFFSFLMTKEEMVISIISVINRYIHDDSTSIIKLDVGITTEKASKQNKVMLIPLATNIESSKLIPINCPLKSFFNLATNIAFINLA